MRELSTPRIIAITGSRDWEDEDAIYRALETLPKGSIVILGDCPTGADPIAYKACRELKITRKREKAEWRKYGRGAGPIRNSAMLDHEPEEVWWFHEDLENSKGTKNCVGQAEERGILTLQGDLIGS